MSFAIAAIGGSARALPPLSADLSAPPVMPSHRLSFGSATRPSGQTLTVDGTSLLLDGKRWLPAMGELHYARFAPDQWRDELLKMRAGGIDVVSTYVFWIHHEEVQGQWDWTGRRDLRRFVQRAGDVGLKVVLRIGPWDHGEVRNGGFPDWLLKMGYKLRSDDPGYLKQVAGLYGQVGAQVHGLLWKDGGPIVGVQVENEFGGRAGHLLTLKRMAVDAGLDVPFYTKTGWPKLASPVPFGQLLPLFGGYAEGFWDRKLTTMPASYRSEFAFQTIRTDTAIASDAFGTKRAEDEANADCYPYLTCELGGGMMPSYHRRILSFPQDAVALEVLRVGSGSNLPGFYMYHGGTNPDSATGIRLNEQQSTAYTNDNDLPVKTYDFQAPLGEFGQVRPHYHLLRRLHLFLRDFGPALAAMPPVLPPAKASPVRWAIRSDGSAGFIFVNNYQRLSPMPAIPGVQWNLKLAGGQTLTVPAEPIAIPADRSFILPFNLDLGGGATLTYATAQPVCTLDDGDVHYSVFADVPGIPATFALRGTDLPADNGTATIRAKPGTGPALSFKSADGYQQRILLLDDPLSLRLYKLDVAGRPRLVLTPATPLAERSAVRLQTDGPGDPYIEFLPPPAAVTLGGRTLAPTPDGLFTRFDPQPLPTSVPATAKLQSIRPYGPLRPIGMGSAHVAAAPTDADFAAAAVWHVALPAADGHRRLLRVHYAGDVARIYAGDRLLTDNFYNGTPFDVGLDGLSSTELAAGLTLKVLPLQRDAPIYMLDQSRPDFGGKDAVSRVDGVALIDRNEVKLDVR
jgi:hypothetical protein